MAAANKKTTLTSFGYDLYHLPAWKHLDCYVVTFLFKRVTIRLFQINIKYPSSGHQKTLEKQ